MIRFFCREIETTEEKKKRKQENKKERRVFVLVAFLNQEKEKAKTQTGELKTEVFLFLFLFSIFYFLFLIFLLLSLTQIKRKRKVGDTARDLMNLLYECTEPNCVNCVLYLLFFCMSRSGNVCMYCLSVCTVCVLVFISLSYFPFVVHVLTMEPTSRVPGLWSGCYTCRLRVSRSKAYRFYLCLVFSNYKYIHMS